MLTVLDLFSGIGGFSLGLERTGGFKTIAFCEIDPFCQRVLAKHWPGVPIYEEVRSLTLPVRFSDVVCGGFPCQDLSAAGRGAGIEGKRSGLWSELCRIIGEVRPRYAIVENVPRLLSGGDGAWMGKILGDLASVGYDAEWNCIPASAVGAAHIRDRVWIVAYPQHPDPDRIGSYRAQGNLRATEPGYEQSRLTRSLCALLADASRAGLEGGQCETILGARRREEGRATSERSQVLPHHGTQWSVEPDVGRVAHGVPSRVDRLRALGNAVVPQVVEIIGRAILKEESPENSRCSLEQEQTF